MSPIKSLTVKILYDHNLKRITGRDYENAVVSEGLNFVNFLNFIFSSYPDIPKKFFAGTLGFKLNGAPPHANDLLKDGDTLEFLAYSIEELRSHIEKDVKEIIAHYGVDTTFEKLREAVLNEKDQKEFNAIIEVFALRIDNIDTLNKVLNVVNAVWNYFPHQSLHGLCPAEKLEQVKKNSVIV